MPYTGAGAGRARKMSGSSTFFHFVARPIFRINIYGAYFVKIQKMLDRPNNH